MSISQLLFAGDRSDFIFFPEPGSWNKCVQILSLYCKMQGDILLIYFVLEWLKLLYAHTNQFRKSAMFLYNLLREMAKKSSISIQVTCNKKKKSLNG